MKIIQTKIIGKDIINNQVYAIAHSENVKNSIYIPEEELGIRYNAENIRNKVNALMGAVVNVAITGTMGAEILLGSRKKAMELLRETKFSQIKDNDIVEGRIIGISPRKIVVEVFGEEIPLRAEDISEKWIQDLRQEYQVGNKVKLRCISKEKMQFSMKEFNPTAWDSNYRRQYKEGQEYIAYVKGIMKSGIIVEFDDGIQAMCPYPHFRAVPRLDSMVVTKISAINEEQKRIWGRITRIVNV